MKNLVLPVFLLLCAAPLPAQPLATEYKSTEVVPGIHMLEGADGFGGGNIALVRGPDRILLIDDGMEPTAPKLIEMAETLAGRPVDFVVSTHAHGDHVGGNAALAEHGALLVAHDNIRQRLLEDPTPAGGEDGLPVLTFSDRVSFHINGLDMHVFHLPAAHTDGDGAIHFPGVNVIHAGDVMFNHMFPFIDLDSGGTVEGYLAAQDVLIGMCDEDTIIIPGHGPLAKRGDLIRDRDMVAGALAKVKALADQGLSADDVVEKNPLAEYHEGWNWGFITTEKMTRTLYRSLAGE